MKIYFATTNKKKLEELRYYLEKDLIQLNEEIQEIQGTEKDIAIDKLYKACKINENKITIIDDCSLDIKGLSGAPGPYFKDFMNIGLSALDKVVEIVGRESVAKCIIGIGIYTEGRFEYKLFSSEINGIIDKFTGEEKCFDDFFVPNDVKRPYSSLSLEESKNSNHRGKAGQKLKEYIESNAFEEKLKYV